MQETAVLKRPETKPDKLVTITRKVELRINTDNQEDKKAFYKTLYDWQEIVYRSANIIASHHYFQENMKEFHYLTDGTKIKLTDFNKDNEGGLNTSKMNTTYQVLSKMFKGRIPMGIITSLNSQIVQTFNKEKKEYYLGIRSLRSYRKDIPIPIRSVNITNMRKHIYRNEHNVALPTRDYAFTLYDIPFRTRFGLDLSGNHIIWDRSLKGEYKLCDSSIQLKKNKIFLLAVFQFEKQKFAVDPNIICESFLDIAHPIRMSIDGKNFSIGDAEEFLHQRLGIQGAIRRTQKYLRWNEGGKGREKKLKALMRYEKAERNYINTKLHQYSYKLINQCLKQNAGTIVLKNQTAKEEEAKQDEFLLRNWSYFNLKGLIEYKASRVGINVVIE